MNVQVSWLISSDHSQVSWLELIRNNDHVQHSINQKRHRCGDHQWYLRQVEHETRPSFRRFFSSFSRAKVLDCYQCSMFCRDDWKEREFKLVIYSNTLNDDSIVYNITSVCDYVITKLSSSSAAGNFVIVFACA